jgi:hypothetical protein
LVRQNFMSQVMQLTSSRLQTFLLLVEAVLLDFVS